MEYFVGVLLFSGSGSELLVDFFLGFITHKSLNNFNAFRI